MTRLRRPARPVLVVLVASALAGGVALVTFQQRAAEAEAKLAAAERALHPAFADAPELWDVDAEAALAAFEAAEASGAEGGVGRAEAQALAYLQAGELVFAEEALDEARRAQGHWTPGLRVLAAEIARAGLQSDAAREHVARALATDPEHPRALLAKADLALDARDGRAAATALARLAEEVPAWAPLHDRRGLALELMGEHAAAREAFERAVELDPRWASGWINLGRARRRAGETVAAREAFDAALGVAPENADGWLGRGLCDLDAGDGAAAREAFERARELAPHDAQAQVALADLAAAEGDGAAAIAGYRAALAENGRDAGVWVKLGNALVRAGQGAEAE
ncbi:MAG TPA: tetratricopeptide repeat protein, partial [Polyangiaceae bacterium LLY-WYZ-15_(1-7)]|nr:tetratricopeptide repeat protein [Polyangiaceae bacterium LLY-WYZ-15_(1-7)]